MAYAGGAPAHEAALVMEAAGNFAPEVAQGVAFGAQARHLAGNITPQAEGVCQVVWGRSASETAVFTDQALAQVADLRSAGAYEAWRNRLAEMWRQAAVVATTR
jgi:predicted phage gp36 major capsid-like protein